MKKPARPGLKPLDFAAILLTLACLAATGWLAWGGRSGNGGQVSVKSGDAVYLFALDKNTVADIPGPLGPTRIEIRDRAARFVDSPCRDKICVKCGWLRNGGDWAACLPNKVFMSVQSDAAAPADVLSF